MDFLPGFAGCNKLFQKVDKGRTGMPLGCNLRHDQWVEPSLRPFLIPANIRSCSLGVRTDGFWPGCRSSISPATPCNRNRSFQREIVGAVVFKTSWIFRYGTPSLSSNIMRALITSPAGRLRDCAICCGSCLSSSLTTVKAALNGMLMRRSILLIVTQRRATRSAVL